MITLITAIPGSGKTLYCLQSIKKMADDDNRQVYYFGIPLTEEGKRILGWIEMNDPHQWHLLPPLAIVVIDESQYVFPVRRSGTTVPVSVDKFATHRHLGIDIFLITQHPRLIDSFIRPLVGRHYHLIRLFGMSRSNLLRWESCQENPNARQAKADCLDKRTFQFPKKVYAWYKSAEAHTVKVRLPKKLFLLGGVLLFIALAVPYVFHSLKGVGDKDHQPQASAAPSSGGIMPGAPAAPSGPARVAPLTPVEYAQARVPRMPGAPDSAPVYDELAKPRTFPRAAACVASARRCQCYTQQGTPIDDLPEGTCRQMVVRSWFDPYRDETPLQQVDRVEDPQRQLQQPGEQPRRSQIAMMGNAQIARIDGGPPMQSDFGNQPHR
ncbi:zonular occludens toxin domain-containing protein [Chromobacterium sp. TRC.1.1.SA]|uniref:Zonular occludens toxin domain-containing protein n=1 Tax=Chromobacterium indicum TaxID=3110228 RepID=A0ABV0CUD3_9NEIS